MIYNNMLWGISTSLDLNLITLVSYPSPPLFEVRKDVHRTDGLLPDHGLSSEADVSNMC
jgi:hypothetical protein